MRSTTTTTDTKLPIRTLLQNINLKLGSLCLQEGVGAVRIDAAGKERIAHAHANDLHFRVAEMVGGDDDGSPRVGGYANGERECKIHVLYWNVYLRVGTTSAKVQRVS